MARWFWPSTALSFPRLWVGFHPFRPVGKLTVAGMDDFYPQEVCWKAGQFDPLFLFYGFLTRWFAGSPQGETVLNKVYSLLYYIRFWMAGVLPAY
jgi:hypothetical protein